MPKYSKTKMSNNMKALYDKTGGACMNCGRHLEFNPINFAHVKGRRISTAQEVENDFVHVCFSLHQFQTIRNENGKQDECVSIFIARYGTPKGKMFFEGLLCDWQNSKQQ